MKPKIFKRYWWKYESKYFHREVWQGIKNIFKWLPIVWKDRDWDHYYIYKALQFKLKNTANYIEKRDRYVGNERDVQRLRTCVKLIENILEDVYELEHMNYYDFEFRSIPVEGKPDLFSLKSDVIRDDSQQYVDKYPTYHRFLGKDDKEDAHSKATRIGFLREKKAKKLLFTIIERNIDAW